jgi:GT2 family glycosyltransferase
MFDLVIPIYNSMHHVSACLNSVVNLADEKINVIIVDDGSDDYVHRRLLDIKYVAKKNFSLLVNQENKGYLYSANKGGFFGGGKYIIFLNSDTVLTDGFLKKVECAFHSDEKIAIVTAVSNWANWTRISWSLPEGHNIHTFSRRIEEVSSDDPISDIYNASGFFFAVRRELFELLNGFDPIYGKGYYEEADFCMKTLSAGYRVVVDESLYVYHSGWGSFKKSARNFNMENNKKLFMERWSDLYKKCEMRWKETNPISYMEKEVLEDKKPHPELLNAKPYSIDSKKASLLIADLKQRDLIKRSKFRNKSLYGVACKSKVVYILPSLGVYGGVISVLQIVNQLVLQGFDANIAIWGNSDNDLFNLFPMYFNPYRFTSEEEMVANFPRCDLIVATHWSTVYPACVIHSRMPSSKMLYFVQDYEPDFYGEEHSDLRDLAEKTYYMIAEKIVKTRWLSKKIEMYPGRVHRIPLGLNLDYFYNYEKSRCSQIIALGRPQSERRNFKMVVEVFSELHRLYPDLKLALYGYGYNTKDLPFPCRDYGKLTHMEDVARAMNDSAVLLDCSTFQGFGRPGLEAMSCGTFAVLTREGGITAYAKHGFNCLLINPFDKVDILKKIRSYLDAPNDFVDYVKNGRRTAEEFSHIIEGKTTAKLINKLIAGVEFERIEPVSSFL